MAEICDADFIEFGFYVKFFHCLVLDHHKLCNFSSKYVTCGKF